ncbi:hypothetical protein BTJ40_06960 [Microbulbifer sp. A4B17]|nr:hypothetical protein BTJ40_06960 [Microbulbifer sp. A4B17]
MDQQSLLNWEEVFSDGSFASEKKGEQEPENQVAQGYKVDGGGRWRRYSIGRHRYFGLTSRSKFIAATTRCYL